MKKLIMMLSTLTMTITAAPLTVVYNENKIMEDEINTNNIPEKSMRVIDRWRSADDKILSTISEFEKMLRRYSLLEISEKKESENFNYEGLNIFINAFLQEDCLKNFAEHYRLNPIQREFVTWTDVIEEFELFLLKKYDIKFKVHLDFGPGKLVIFRVLHDGVHRQRIHISLFKTDNAWQIVGFNLYLHFKHHPWFKRKFEPVQLYIMPR